MKVLIVGGAGYIGGCITDFLHATPGFEVTVFDSLVYEIQYRKEVDFVFGDIRERDLLKNWLDWSDAVVWLAAVVGDGACQLNPTIATELNQESVKWLAENYDKRIIFMSTCSVYGTQDKELDEESPKNPLSVYASTKLKAEDYLKDKNAVIFRLGTIFGVGDLFSRIRLDLVVNILTTNAYRLGKIKVFGGDQFRPLLHVKDIALAVHLALESDATGIFNLCRQNVRIIDLAYQVRNHFPDLIIEQTEMMFQDTRNYRVTAEKAKQVLKFKPAYSIDDGIEELKYLIETNRIVNLEDPRYTNVSYLKENEELLHTAKRAIK